MNLLAANAIAGADRSFPRFKSKLLSVTSTSRGINLPSMKSSGGVSNAVAGPEILFR